MHFCVTTLLDPTNIDNPDEEKIELLCKLLMSIGEKLDVKVDETFPPFVTWVLVMCILGLAGPVVFQQVH